MQIKSSEKISLIDLLGELSPDSSKNTLRSWIEKKRVTIDGKLAKYAKDVVEPGSSVVVGVKPKFLEEGVKILYEDDSLVVIDKPRDLLSVATNTETRQTAHAFLKRRFKNQKVYPIHRLDRDTSGLLIFAYTEKARDHLKEQLAERTMHREYEALVHGHPGDGTWNCFLRENKQMVVFVCPPSGGKEAITHFETLKKVGSHSLLKLKLESGRKHQIRVHAAHYGFPIVGDSKYGLEDDRTKHFKLCAVALEFEHPIRGKTMRIVLDQNRRSMH